MKKDRTYLVHILECIDRIDLYTQGGQKEFLADSKTQDAVIRNFEIIGEATKRLSESIRENTPEFPWSGVARFRDVLIHQYEGVDLDEVWRRVEEDVPVLRKSLTRLLANLE